MSTPPTLKIGTRGSALALWQANHVADLLREAAGAPATEIVPIATTGDIVRDVPLSQVEGRSFFTKELDEALLDGRIDLAVHSLKDVATRLPAGLALAAVPKREDPRDALVTRSGAGTLSSLPAGARIATSSVRRRAFVQHVRGDLRLADLRGNVPTRLRYLDEGRFDAIIVAAAGLNRLGLARRIDEYLDPSVFPPAAAQGALAVCAREDDELAMEVATALDDLHSHIATSAERAFLRELEAGCQVPAGVLATVQYERLHLHGARCEPDGSGWASASLDAALDAWESAGKQLAIDLEVGVL
jgi:hydroxymethylbilane synthase